MTAPWYTITGAGSTTTTKFYGDATNNISNLFLGVDVSATAGAGPVVIHNNVTWTFGQNNIFAFNPAGTFTYQIQTSAITANRVLTLPLLTGADTVAVLALAQTFTNKKLNDGSVNFISNGDATKILAFSCTGITTGNTRTLTIPDASDTIAVLGFAQTFTAMQTFTTVKTTIPDIVGTNSNTVPIIKFVDVASALNYPTITSGATGNPALISATGETNSSIKLVPKGTGVVFGNRETWDYAVTDETTAPTTGVKITDGIPYNFTLTDVQVYLTTPGTGAALFTVDVLYESGQNTNSFSTIFSTKPTVNASDYTSVTAATPMVLSVTALAKGRRLQYKVDTLDSNGLARGAKIMLIGYATAV